jgi:DNA polymerase III delta prime subunit
MNTPLALKYRTSARLKDVRGQAPVVAALKSFLKHPCSRALLFSGNTGIGKTFTGYALANELGVDMKWPEVGGFCQLASGETTAARVREVLNDCHLYPMFGSGWRVVVVNECDRMTEGADTIWLDGLENLPPRTLIVFTTNQPEKLSLRFRDRCLCFEFESEARRLRKAAQALIAEVWRKETGGNHTPTLRELGCDYKYGSLSFRNILTRLEPRLMAAIN